MIILWALPDDKREEFLTHNLEFWKAAANLLPERSDMTEDFVQKRSETPPSRVQG